MDGTSMIRAISLPYRGNATDLVFRTDAAGVEVARFLKFVNLFRTSGELARASNSSIKSTSEQYSGEVVKDLSLPEVLRDIEGRDILRENE
jgi:hypothetical protein